MDLTGILGGVGIIVLIVLIAVVTIVPIIASTGVMLFFTARLLSQASAQRKARLELMATGVPAQATVQQLSVRDVTTQQGAHRALQLSLMLEVEALDLPGRGPQPSYTTTITTMVPEIAVPRVQPQCQIPVRVDPDDTGRIAIDLVAMGYPDAGRYL